MRLGTSVRPPSRAGPLHPPPSHLILPTPLPAHIAVLFPGDAPKVTSSGRVRPAAAGLGPPSRKHEKRRTKPPVQPYRHPQTSDQPAPHAEGWVVREWAGLT